MLGKIKESGRRCVVSGILPHVYASREWLSRVIGVNEQLKVVCEKVGMTGICSLGEGSWMQGMVCI